MQKTIRFLAILFILPLLSACYPNLSGTWKITSTTTSWGSYSGCGVHKAGETKYFEVTQDGGEIGGNSIANPSPGIASGQVGDFSFFGQVPARLTGDDADLVYWLPDSSTPDNCGDRWKGTGSLKGSIVTGTFVAGDCNSEYGNTRRQVNGQWIEGCWWKGTFTAEITR